MQRRQNFAKGPLVVMQLQAKSTPAPLTNVSGEWRCSSAQFPSETPMMHTPNSTPRTHKASEPDAGHDPAHSVWLTPTARQKECIGCTRRTCQSEPIGSHQLLTVTATPHSLAAAATARSMRQLHVQELKSDVFCWYNSPT